MRRRIYNGNITTILASDICARAVRQKYYGPRPSACLDCSHHTLLIGIDRKYFALLFAGDVDLAVPRVYPDTFWFVRDFHFSTRLPGAKIDNGSARIIFIRNKSEPSILAYRELLWIRADMPEVNQLALHGIDDRKTICGLVCWCAIFVQTGSHSWRPA